ncbi:hypothetical protein M0802_007935 [Mischocyttarus mexicanus]|nr:hypothetical protein M0802_007935 [Mischocyttarus mexicanus]
METTRSTHHTINNINNRNYTTYIQKTFNTAENTNIQTSGSTKSSDTGHMQYSKNLPKQRRIKVELGLAIKLAQLSAKPDPQGRIKNNNCK